MGLNHLDHYSIEAADMEATKRFYCDLLGLRDGERPALPFPGAWLYSENGLPTVHVIGMGPGESRPVVPSGLFHHISFACTGAEDVRARLEQADVKFRVVVLPGFGNTQFFMKDPNGVSVELNFPASETRQSDIDAQNNSDKESFFLRDEE